MTELNRLYVSGSITGLERNVYTTAFHAAVQDGLAKGWLPINPLNVSACDDHSCLQMEYNSLQPASGDTYGQHTWECYMRHDIMAMMGCSTILMLQGWRRSKGARLELSLAAQLGMPILFMPDFPDFDTFMEKAERQLLGHNTESVNDRV